MANLENKETQTPITSDGRQSSDDSPNAVSENVVKCLLSILLRKRSTKSRGSGGLSFSMSRLASQNCSNQTEFLDPYGVCSKFGKRDIGPYKRLCSIEANSINTSCKTNSSLLIHRLK